MNENSQQAALVRAERRDYEGAMRRAMAASQDYLRTLTPNAELVALCAEKECPAFALKGAQITSMREHEPEARENELNKWTIEAAGQSFVVPAAFIWRVSPAVGGWLVYKPPSPDNDLPDDGVGFVPASRVARLYDVAGG